MGIIPGSTVVGVFEDRLQADQAISDLRRAGFGADQIECMVHGEHGEDSEHPVEKGLLPAEKGETGNEFKQGRSIVTVKAGERAHEAREILHRHGAFDAYTPLAEETKHGTSTGKDAADTLRPDQAVDLNASSSFFEQPEGMDPRLPGTRPSPDVPGPRIDENN
ncbi:MAG TPA: hypothetical protein VFQ30_01460 [Ktedonobacteraceae bacterium]|nr:hypothetical protein [Ktedonobacteraceae bacterium]